MVLVEPSPPCIPGHRGVAEVQREAARVVVWLRGEHDISTVAVLSAVLHDAAAVADGGLVVDLGKVRFIDASTIGAILACRNALGLQGRSLIIRSPARPARRLLDICGLQSILDPREVVRRRACNETSTKQSFTPPSPGADRYLADQEGGTEHAGPTSG